jgi:hypothetical protein
LSKRSCTPLGWQSGDPLAKAVFPVFRQIRACLRCRREQVLVNLQEVGDRAQRRAQVPEAGRHRRLGVILVYLVLVT